MKEGCLFGLGTSDAAITDMRFQVDLRSRIYANAHGPLQPLLVMAGGDETLPSDAQSGGRGTAATYSFFLHARSSLSIFL